MTPQDFYTIYLQHPQVCTDSRKIIPGCLFFALKGDQFDGNQFVSEAFEKGCRYAVVDSPSATINDHCFLVTDVLAFLQELASYHRSRLSIPVLALTGTNGKTTTKELIHSILQQGKITVATMGNLNNHIGVPLTILSSSADTQILVVEMGANHPGEIRFLTAIVKPTHGLITNIGKAHLEGFGSFENIIQAKSELFEYIRETGGIWFSNNGDPLLNDVRGDYPAITYGTDPGAMIRGSVTSKGFHLDAEFALPGNVAFSASTHLTGSYNINNILAAVAVGFHFNIPPDKIQKGLEEYTPRNMRSEWRKTDQNTLFLDAYNANPTSMELAIRYFHSLDISGKVLILGDMFELGIEAEPEHRAIIRLVTELGFSRVFFIGQEFSMLSSDSRFAFFPGRNDLIAELSKNPLHDCTILVKGSRGMELEKIVDYL
ncbi:MAG: UDP-N-acetylmuramoyl-tripeptide--D-alanyl-D-alanine ligase [Bacteroidota bacterium]